MAELVWRGKGESAAIKPLPLRTVEIVGAWNDGGNRLIAGDAALVLPGLMPELKSRVDLIYFDPPHGAGSDFATRRGVAFRDTWGGSVDGYLSWLTQTLRGLKALLAESGTICVHVDRVNGHLTRMILDELFGATNLLSEVIWHCPRPARGAAAPSAYASAHDCLLFYAQRKGSHVFRGEGLDDVWEIPIVAEHSSERVGYPTQKPLALLERIIEGSSRPGALVLDACCGSGTAAVAAQRLGRRWVAADRGRLAVYTAYKRLLAEGAAAFAVQDLGAHEWIAWQAAQGGEGPARKLLLSLFGAEARVGPLDRPLGEGDLAPPGAVLGWEVDAEVPKGTRVHLIPRDALEGAKGTFYAAPPTDVRATVKGRTVSLELAGFLELDRWAVDWEWSRGPLQVRWQSELERTATYEYARSGPQRIRVKVVDLFGNAALRTIDVTVP